MGRKRQIELAMKQQIARRVVGLSDTSLGHRLSGVTSTIDGLFNNDTDDSEINGECWLLDQLATGTPTSIFDVGAHEGGWSRMARSRMAATQIHAFEPVPAAFRALERLAASDQRLIANNVALSRPGATVLDIWTDNDDDGRSSSATANLRSAPPTSFSCTTGDEYMAKHGIDHIDLLKIDVEGHELQVLKGFGQALESSMIDVIQFEFTLWSAIARVWLADYYELLEPHGYRVGKLLPSRVEWASYAPSAERFLRCNYVAALPGSPFGTALGLAAA